MANGLLILGAIILIGVLGNLLFNRTRIPESLFLILAGILIGPVMGWVPQELFIENSSFFVTIALVMVLLNSGLNLDLYQTVKNAGYTILYTVLVLLLTMVITAGIAVYFGWDIIHGAFLGIVVSGTTAVTITHLVRKLKTDRNTMFSDTKNILVIESVLSDLTVIASASILLSLAETGVNPQSLFILIFNALIVSLVVGMVLGIGWVFLYRYHMHGSKLSYIFTVGLAFLIYFVAEWLGLNGAITIMAFSLIIGNHKVVVDIFRTRSKLFKQLEHDVFSMKKTDTEFSFLITTFFFVLLGIIFDPSVLGSTMVILLAVAVVGGKLIARYLSALVMSPMHRSFQKARFAHTSLAACGVASTLVAFLAIDKGVPIPNFAEIVLLLIIMSTMVAIIGTVIQERLTEAKESA